MGDTEGADMTTGDTSQIRVPKTLEDCRHIDEVHQYVTKTQGLTGVAAEAGA